MEFELLGICWDKKPFRNRADKAPDEIRKVLPFVETFQSNIELADYMIRDLGNIKPKSYKEMEIEVERKLGKSFPIILGGDHSITFSVVKKIKPKVFVSLDAHPDCEPLNLCYWSVTRKISELGIKSFVYGARCISKNEDIFIREGKVKLASLEDLKKINEPIYLSIDFDVLDPSIMPAGGYPEPNGLTFKQVLEAVRTVAKNVIAIDFVEFIPDNTDSSPFIAANLIYSVLAEIIKSK